MRPVSTTRSAIAQAAAKLRARPRGAAGGEPGRNRAADGRLYPDAGAIAPDPGRADGASRRRCSRPRARLWTEAEAHRSGHSRVRPGRTRRTTSARASTAAPRKCARSPAGWSQSDASAVPQLRGTAGRRGPDQRSASARRRRAAQPRAARRSGDGGGRRRRPYRRHAAGARRSGRARRARPRPRDPARRPRRRGRLRRAWC